MKVCAREVGGGEFVLIHRDQLISTFNCSSPAYLHVESFILSFVVFLSFLFFCLFFCFCFFVVFVCLFFWFGFLLLLFLVWFGYLFSAILRIFFTINISIIYIQSIVGRDKNLYQLMKPFTCKCVGL